MGIHKVTGEIYFGYREANKMPSNIDLYIYRTSSKVVHPNFDDYTWFIVAEFFTGIDAYNFEQQLIYENWSNPLLLNKHCMYGQERWKPKTGPQSDRTKKLKSLKKTGVKRKPFTEEHRLHMSINKQGKKYHQRYKQAMTDDERLAAKQLRQLQNKEEMYCSQCGNIVIGHDAYNRFHKNRCILST